MKMFITTGTHRFLPPGFLAVPSAVWPEQAVPMVAMPPAGGRRSAADLAGYHARFRTFVNPISVDLPVTDRLRTSASEP